MSATTIKAAIKTHLDNLVTAGTLGEAVNEEFNKDFAEHDIAAWPAAILTPPMIANSEMLTNNENLREYEFEIVIIHKGEDLTSDEIEVAMDAILIEFENDPVLGGEACGGLTPVTTAPAPVPTQDKSYVMYSIFLRYKSKISLTF